MAKQKRVYFNFEDGPDGEGVQMGVVWEGGFDKDRSLHRFCVNLLDILEKEAVSKGFEVVNGDEVFPSNAPVGTVH